MIIFSYCVITVCADNFVIKDESDVFFKVFGSDGHVTIGTGDYKSYRLYVDGATSVSGNVDPGDHMYSSNGNAYADFFGPTSDGNTDCYASDPYYRIGSPTDYWYINAISGNAEGGSHQGLMFRFGQSLISSSKKMVLDAMGDLWISGSYLLSSSDSSLKKDIKPIKNALDKTMALRGITYKRKDISDDLLHFGLIAQEAEKIVPEVVHTCDESAGYEGYKSISYPNLIALLIEAIKEDQREIIELERIICTDYPSYEICDDLKGGEPA